MKKLLLILSIVSGLYAQNQVIIQAPGPTAVSGNTQLTATTTCTVVEAGVTCPGNKIIQYWLVVHYPIGVAPLGGPYVLTNAPSPQIDAFNFVTLSWPSIPGASSYDILKNFPGDAPPQVGVSQHYAISACLGVTATTCQDKGVRTDYTLSQAAPPSQATITLDNQNYSVPTLIFSTPVNIPGSGTGTGTVTATSAGNLANIFTSNVATATTTPNITFTPVAFSADSIFGNFTAGSANPSTQAIPNCPNNGSNALVYDTHTLTCETVTGTGIGGGGTTNTLATFASSSTVGNSQVTENPTVLLTIAEPTQIGTTGQSTLTMFDSGGTATTPTTGNVPVCVTPATNACAMAWAAQLNLSPTLGNLSLGTDNSVSGNIQLSAAGAAAHGILSGSQVTTTNTLALPAAVIPTGNLIKCTTASTTCTLADSGISSTSGLGVVVATKALATQSAAIANSTSLFTPAAAGLYEVCYYSKVTRAASSSSILGGTAGFQVLYTDPTDSVAQTVTLPATSQAGNTITIGTGNTGNATTTSTNGCGVYQMSTAAVTYGWDYSSTGGTTMQYELRVKVIGPY